MEKRMARSAAKKAADEGAIKPIRAGIRQLKTKNDLFVSSC